MKLSLFIQSEAQEVIDLFTKVFSASENESEGQIIGNLVSELISTTEPQDLIGCIATSNNLIVGCIFFSRFVVANGQVSFILSPVAISISKQGSGIGQQLINYGLNHLKSIGVNLAFTYGAPGFYSKTGFKQISENVVKAPYVLSQPEGWLAQSLDGNPIKVIHGSTKCVEALSDQKYW